MALTKEKNFVEISYIGRIKETNQIFDLTDENLAKKENIYNPNALYGNKIICLGEKHILEELDKQLIGKEINKDYKIELTAEQAFGKKNPDLVRVVPTITLQKQRINPFPGLQINASGLLGTIRAVSGGRTTIDFNHPLASKNLVYEIKIERIVDKDDEKLQALMINLLGLDKKDYELNMENNKASIKLKVVVPEKAKEELEDKTKELIPRLEISFL